VRICFVCNEYPPARHGGVGVFTSMLATALARAGHDVRVIGACRLEAGLAPEAEEDGVRIWRLPRPAGRVSWIPARYEVIRTVLRWARRGEIDVVEVPDYQGWAAGCPRMKAPLVVRLHGCASYFAAETGARVPGPTFWIEGAALRRADFLCSCSRHTAVRTANLFDLAPAIEVLHNGVEVPPAPVARRARHMVVFSGTLARKKGVEALIDAWPLVKSRHPEAELHIFGKDGRAEGGSMRAALEHRLNGATSSVRFHGAAPRPAVLSALASARVAVFPSFAEAFALAPLEAMAHACPTIYSRRGSGPELIRDGQDGLLVEPSNHEEIAAAVLRVLADDDLAARLAIAGRRRVIEHFSWDVLLEKNLAWYRSCLERFHKR
jgi:glycosyltransferase involved in cell wall biosynthesis